MNQSGSKLASPIEDTTRNFVGREWLFRQVDDFLTTGEGQYFVISGEPGIGKSAFALRLTQIKKVHAYHFCSALKGGTLDPISFAGSLSQQLTRSLPDFGQYVVEHTSQKIIGTVETKEMHGGTAYGVYINNFIVQTKSAAAAFQYLVREPLTSWSLKQSPSEPVILLVDALDEATRLDRHPNIFDLIKTARDLPHEIRWLLTSRPSEDVRSLSGVRAEILDDSDENQKDVRTFVKAFLNEPPITRFLEANQREPSALREELIKRSQGNFLYLHYVFNSIRENANAGSSLVTPEQLPIGLPGVYEEFLERILLDKPPDAWKRIYRLVLGILAVARESLTFDLLVSLTGITPQDVNDVLSDLKQFLDIGNDPSIDSYRIYHTSFAEFLTTRKQNPTRWIDAASYHWRISDFYLNAWGGLDNSLANLHAPERHDSRDEYGLRYLPAHLEGADRVQDLHRLVRLERRVGEQRENVWYSVKARTGQLNGYLRDIERAWRHARLNQNMGLQVRYALYLSSVRNLNNIPLPLLEMATRYGVLSWQQALDCSQLYRDPVDRAKALVRLIPLLHGTERDNAIKDALEIAIANQDTEILATLVPNLPVLLLDDVLELTQNIAEESARTKLLLTLTAHVSEQQLGKINKIAGSIDDSLLLVRAWGSIATRLSGDERNEFLEAMNETVNAMPEGADKVQGLCEMVACQEGDARTNSLDAGLLIAGTLEYADNLAVALGALAQQDLTESQIAKSLEIAEQTYDTEDHMGTLEMYISVLFAFRKLLSREQWENIITKFVSRLWPTKLELLEESNGLLAGILGLSLTADQPSNQFGELVPYLVRGAKSRNYLFRPIRRRTVLTREWKREAALIVLTQLSKDLIETALQSTARIYNDDDRADILYALVPGLPETRRRKLLAEEVTRVQSFGDKGTKTTALSSLVGYLPTDQRSGFAESLLKEAQTFDEYSFELTATLAPYLEKHRVDEVIQQALLATAELKESRSRREAVKALSPVLPELRIPQALEIAEGLKIADYLAFAALVPRLKGDQRHNIIDKCLTAAQGWVAAELPEDFVHALKSLAPYMDDSQVDTALKICGHIREEQRLQALVVLAPWLRKKQLEEALVIVHLLGPETNKAHAMAALVPHLEGDERASVLSDALKAAKHTYSEGRIDVGTLSLLLPQVEEDDHFELLSKALSNAKAVDEDDDRATILCALLPCLSGTNRLDAFNEMLESCGGSRVAFSYGGNRFRENIGREFLLRQIAGSSGTLSSIGGEEVAVEIVSAIRDTSAWWP